MENVIFLDGSEFLRNLVEWMNSRPESLNEGKTTAKLICEYKNYLYTKC